MTGAGLYLDDLSVGQRFASRGYPVTAEAIKAFAAEFDPQPFHLDEAAAAASLLRRAGGQRLAHRGDHHAADDRRRPAARRRGDRRRRRAALAAGHPARRRPDGREHHRGDQALAVAPRPRHADGVERDPQPARRGRAGSRLERARLPPAGRTPRVDDGDGEAVPALDADGLHRGRGQPRLGAQRLEEAGGCPRSSGRRLAASAIAAVAHDVVADDQRAGPGKLAAPSRSSRRCSACRRR